MAYNKTSKSYPKQLKTFKGEPAPKGFHFMPNGKLMSDVEHAFLYQDEHVISDFELDLSPILSTGENRVFSIIGTVGSKFSLFVTNEDSPKKYYNFYTGLFQDVKTGLVKQVIGDNGNYSSSIFFPAITDNDHYDISLFAELGTIHSDYNEVRFGDDTIDINSSTGSNSLLYKKIIYQNLPVNLTLRASSPNDITDLIKPSTIVDDVINIDTGFNKAKTPFSISCETNSALKTYIINRQPLTSDFFSSLSTSVGDPIHYSGENIYPVVDSTATVNGDFSSASVGYVDFDAGITARANDKISAPTKTQAVTAGVTSGNVITINLDGAHIKTVVAVGDFVTGITNQSYNVPSVITVSSIISATQITINTFFSGSMKLTEGDVLTFTPSCNVIDTFVTSIPSSTRVNTSRDVGLVDNTVVSFSNRKYKSWNISNINGLEVGNGVLAATNITSETSILPHDTVRLYDVGLDTESTVSTRLHPGVLPTGIPVITNGVTTSQPGSVSFNDAQVDDLYGDTIVFNNYGLSAILKFSGYDIKISNLSIKLNEVSTTITSASPNSNSFNVTSAKGIRDDLSIVSGIGIDASVANPTVTNITNVGGGTWDNSGQATVTVSSNQTLETGINLAFAGAGNTATITGYIEIIKAGNYDAVINLDVENLLSIA